MDEVIVPGAAPIKYRDDRADTWRPVGLLVRKIARELQIPRETAIAALEANRIDVEAR